MRDKPIFIEFMKKDGLIHYLNINEIIFIRQHYDYCIIQLKNGTEINADATYDHIKELINGAG